MKPPSRNGWQAALSIIERLRANGHTALLAGGCVRDRLLGITAKDYDVVTDATPKRVHALFPQAQRVGAQFGVMLVHTHGHAIEVATFRSDGPYSDGRHPDEVRFGNETEDAQRRDFTINGLFLDPVNDRIIDHVGGRKDLESRIVRTIGDPELRFAEDHLRMLRAIRFAARLGFAIESHTLAAIKRLASRLAVISPERVAQELEAILTAPSRATGWRLMVETGLRSYLDPDWLPDDREDDLAMRRFAVLPADCISPFLALATAMALREPAEARTTCSALRFSNRLTDGVCWLVSRLHTMRSASAMELADLKMMMAHGRWDDLLELFGADLISAGESSEPLEHVRRRAEAVPQECVAPPPLITGDDLHKLGLAPGPKFGELLNLAYRTQLNEQIATRDEAIELVRSRMGE